VKQGKLKAWKVGTRWYVSEDTLEELFDTPDAKRGETYPEKKEWVTRER
jgi:hypothetical protein